VSRPVCFFATGWPDAGPCDGRLIRAHLVRQQVLTREGHDAARFDPRSWIWCCGGPGYGNAGHHGMLDNGQLRIGIERLPEPFLELMRELSMTWFVVKHYGVPRSARLEQRCFS
jgi:hypothetical protein